MISEDTRRRGCRGRAGGVAAFGPGFVAASALAAVWFVAGMTHAQPAVADAPSGVEVTEQSIPEAAFRFRMVTVPGSADGSIKPFAISATEITWEAMDVFVYRRDEEAGTVPPGVDAVSRPSKPYIPPDRGFGHEGFAAISISFKSAQAFCAWMSARTGQVWRLPTEAEWEHAARAGASDEAPDLGGATVETLDEHAWFAGNSGEAPKAVGTRRPNAWGLHDMLGNAREWVVGRDGKPTTKGGSYLDGPGALAIGAAQPQTPAWNASDPQIPKSKWWLSDGPHVGFRVVREINEQDGGTPRGQGSER